MGYRFRFFAIFLPNLFLPALIFAETIVLKSGSTVEGKLLEKTADYVKIDFYGAQVTYYLDEIASIDGKSPSLIHGGAKDLVGSLQTKETSEKYKEAFSQGMAYHKANQFAKAISSYTQAIELKPLDPDAYGNRGYAYGAMGYLERAAADYSKAIELDKNYIGAYFMRGYICNAKGDFEQAISDFTEAIRINPDFTEAYANRGYSYSAMGHNDQAIFDYTKALELNPKYALVYANRALAYYLEKNYALAWEDLHKAKGLGHLADPQFLAELKQASGREK